MVIAVDFDGTIVEHEYPRIGRAIPFAIETLLKLQQERHILLLWSVREGDLLQEAVDYCESKGLKFYAANKNHPEEDRATAARKLDADLFIDDRNLGGLPDWGVIYHAIQAKERGEVSFEKIMMLSGESKTSRRKKNFFIRLGEMIEKNKGY
ncbi:hypothetical protein D0T53_02835 [Dysgonomonas sp. 216]|uniref:BT0820 family HAD-type phosphatase n=1 Tax=Dysgonomonas sp. 216 TaxID=2302934 RepID=UPI0013D537FE|nr:hypothetical protein [Dysgonomonas sp. 216]NDW17852.1 hypothetical protein [Dysgonomonas sp. 216]